MSDHKPPFAVSYRHRGAEYTFTIWANSWDDAEDRLRSISTTGRVYGSDVSTTRCHSLTLPFAATWAALRCWWLNLRNRP